MNDEVHRRSVLGIVPARGGSKGIARKNIRLLDGLPLVAYTAAAALKSRCLTRVILSTEDPEIACVGKSAGLDVPFTRPAVLASDTTPMIDVILHAVRWAIEGGEEYDAVCLLQPTSPLRTSQTIDRCVRLLWEKAVDTVVSVRPVPPEYNPYWVYFEGPDGFLQPSIASEKPITARQQLPPAYHRDGSVFAAWTRVLLKRGSLYGETTLGVISPEEEAFDLDTEEQWESLERKLKSTQKTSPSERSRRSQ